MDFYSVGFDLSKLHIEFVKQIKLFEYWSKKSVEATTKKDNLKKEMEEHEAQLDLYFRKNWEQVHPEIKLTEASIKSAIKTDEEMISKIEEYLFSVQELNSINSMKNVLEQRKTALENAVKLYTAGYFTTQYVDKEVNDYFSDALNKETGKELEKNERIKKLKKKKRIE